MFSASRWEAIMSHGTATASVTARTRSHGCTMIRRASSAAGQTALASTRTLSTWARVYAADVPNRP